MSRGIILHFYMTDSQWDSYRLFNICFQQSKNNWGVSQFSCEVWTLASLYFSLAYFLAGFAFAKSRASRHRRAEYPQPKDSESRVDMFSFPSLASASSRDFPLWTSRISSTERHQKQGQGTAFQWNGNAMVFSSGISQQCDTNAGKYFHVFDELSSTLNFSWADLRKRLNNKQKTSCRTTFLSSRSSLVVFRKNEPERGITRDDRKP